MQTPRSHTADFAFGIHVHDEPLGQLAWCLEHLRCAYPAAPVLVIGDSACRDYGAACGGHGAMYHGGERLKVPERGGAWWARFFRLLLPHQTAVVVKLDPDTLFHRPFHRPLPDADVFGSLLGVGSALAHVQGGCHMFRQRAALAMTLANAFGFPELTDIRAWAPPPLRDRMVRERYLSSDFTMMYVVRRLGLIVADYSDVRSRWKGAPPEPCSDVAVSHRTRGQAPNRVAQQVLHVRAPSVRTSGSQGVPASLDGRRGR